MHTFTGRFTSNPLSCSITSASTVSHQAVACVTTVGGILSKCCPSSVINTAIGWISQIATVHSCQKCITSCKNQCYLIHQLNSSYLIIQINTIVYWSMKTCTMSHFCTLRNAHLQLCNKFCRTLDLHTTHRILGNTENYYATPALP